MSGHLPPGITQEMCEYGIIDDNQPCGYCCHELSYHDEIICNCCKKEHEECKHISVCSDHEKSKPDERDYTHYCSSNFHRFGSTGTYNKDGSITWKKMGKDTGRTYGKVYYSDYTVRKPIRKNSYTVILGHSEAINRWHEEIHKCVIIGNGLKTVNKEMTRCHNDCDCTFFDDCPPEPDDYDPYDD